MSEFDEERKQTVRETTMPTGMKGMQRFLGVAVFFSEYVPDFASKTIRRLGPKTMRGSLRESNRLCVHQLRSTSLIMH